MRIPGARLIVLGLGVAAAATILWLSHAYTFYFDEWDFIQAAPGWGFASFLQPHNEHPSMLFRLVYSALLNTVGLRSYVPYMVVLLALHLLDALLLLEVVRRRAGDLVGVAAAAILLVLGAGWEDLLWAFQIAWLASIACGLGMVLMLDGPAGARRAAAAAALLAASLMFSGIGVPFGALAAVQLGSSPSRRKDLLWFIPVGLALGAWYISFGHSGTAPSPPPSAANVLLIPGYMVWGLAGSAGGLIGVGGIPALGVLALAVAALGYAWWRRRPDPLALGVAAGLLSFYLLTGLTRAQLGYLQSASGRYVYVAAVLWLILLADAARLLPWRGTWRPALAACLLLACFSGSVLLFEWATARSVLMQRQVADLQALSAERSDQCLDPMGVADRLVMPQVDRPAVYYRAIDRYGDPTAGLPITDQPDFDRARSNLTRSGCTPT